MKAIAAGQSAADAKVTASATATAVSEGASEAKAAEVAKAAVAEYKKQIKAGKSKGEATTAAVEDAMKAKGVTKVDASEAGAKNRP